LIYDEILEIYGITAENLISGLRVMEHNLSAGRLDAMNKIENLIDNLPEDIKHPTEDFLKEAQETTLQVIGIDLFDVKKYSKWPDSLIEDLSLGVNEDNTFYSHDEFKGWPLWELPIQRKPFIKLSGISYCFDYYNFFDNFYRSLKKAVFSHGDQYQEKWKISQTNASEKLVEKIFEDILPGCNGYKSNHYKIKGGSAENDLIILYKDVLFIVEIKAGAFTYTKAFFDIQAHKRSLDALIQKAEKQCIRTKDFICSSTIATFYKDDALEQFSFSIKSADYSQIYMLSVTVDDINEIASAVEKIQIVKAKEDIVSLSLDDLWVYRDYFDSPAEFIHFIKQRILSTKSQEVYTFDELDHLGLYIKHNIYTRQAEDIGRGNTVHFNGYREELDRYYAGKLLGKKIVKPKQNIPKSIRHIILECIENAEIEKPLQFTNFLLDLSSESRQTFEDSICKLSKREKAIGRMIPLLCFGEANYCLLIKIPGISSFEANRINDYVEANLLKSGRDQCYLIQLELNSSDEIIDVYAKLYKCSEIKSERTDFLKSYGDEIVSKRIENFKIQNHKKKIYPNDPCPCGSGKKYKKCCGRNI
jgi:hypothetical protein